MGYKLFKSSSGPSGSCIEKCQDTEGASEVKEQPPFVAYEETGYQDKLEVWARVEPRRPSTQNLNTKANLESNGPAADPSSRLTCQIH